MSKPRLLDSATYLDIRNIIGTYSNFTTADNALIELNPIGKTIETLANPALEKSPDNPATFTDYNQGGNSKARSYNINMCPIFSNQSQNGVNMTVDSDGTIHLNGTASNDIYMYANNANYNNFLFIPAGSQYALSCNNPTFPTGTVNAIFARFNTEGSSKTISLAINAINRKSTFSATESFVANRCYIYITSGTVLTDFTLKLQLEHGTVSTSYTPPKSDEITISFSGGDLPNGVADTPDYTRIGKYVVVSNDITTLDTTSSAINDFVNIVYTNMTGIIIPTTQDNEATSMRTSVSMPRNNVLGINKHWKNPNNMCVSFAKGKYATLADARTALTGMVILYQLATPIPRTPTKQYLKSWSGVTNVFNLDPVQTTFTWVAKSELSANKILTDVAIDTKASKTLSVITIPTFTNSWVVDGAFGYYINSFGELCFMGALKSGVLGSSAFTLPTGFRPIRTLRVSCLSNGVLGYIIVNTNGTVIPQGNNAYISLDGIHLRLDI